jgi:AcrR family transcriptional regulator
MTSDKIGTSEKAGAVKYQTPLRQAQRDLTRNRIKQAARELFFQKHYDTTTMDDIASAAGLRRSTLYLHYRDKAEILQEVISDYAPKACATLALLPGPKPSLARIETWLKTVVQLVAQERVPLSIILELRRNRDNMTALMALTDQLLGGLGTNNPVFIRATSAGTGLAHRARAMLLLQQLTYACEFYLDDGGNAFGSALLRVTAQDFHAYLHEG